jgi:hypothetical protein
LLHALPHAGSPAIASAVFLGLAPSAIGFILWAHAMTRMDVGQATTSLYLVPAAAIVISLIWLSQIPGIIELAGGALALAGVILASTRPRHRRHQPSAGAQAASRAPQLPRAAAAIPARPAEPAPGRSAWRLTSAGTDPGHDWTLALCPGEYERGPTHLTPTGRHAVGTYAGWLLEPDGEEMTDLLELSLRPSLSRRLRVTSSRPWSSNASILRG